MVPEGEELPPSTTISTDDVMLAGYRECAMEALNWLLNLGYGPGHPLIRSLAAHLTKKQAYLEKINLETYLIDEAFNNSTEDFNEDKDVDADSRYDVCARQVRNNQEIQRSLVDAVFRGCDLQYDRSLP